jgi:predicted Zn-dependent peptidase
MSDIKITTLNNGLRVITDSIGTVHSAAIGIWTGVGTRNEELAHNGVAHMVEHMLFKGTKRRTALGIAEEVENVGGHMNAYTSKEITSYYIHLLKEDVPLALDILSDIYQFATLPEEEVVRERHVILQEIGMCLDTPDDLIFDNYYETAYPGQALGAPILGKSPHISRMERTTLEDYIKKFYTPARTIISAAGNINHDDFVAQVEKLFFKMPEDTFFYKDPANYLGGEHRQTKDLEQAHIILGFKGLTRLDDDYITAQALSTLLGGGMSSRLFQEVREKRGLVYSIYSFHSGYADDGQFGIYAGTGPKDIKELVPVVCDEIMKVSSAVSEAEVERAKSQLKSGMLIGRESMIARAEQQAKYLFYKGKTFDVNEAIAKIDAITPEAITRAAKKIFSGRPTLAALGPLDRLESYEKISGRLTG